MTTPSSPAPVTVFALSGSGLGPFATGFVYEQASEVSVVIETDGVEAAPLNPSGDYTLSGASPLSGGGNVTLNSGVRPSGGWGDGVTAPVYRLILRRATTATQDVNFSTLDRYNPVSNMAALDKLTRRAQDQAQTLKRVPTVAQGETGPQLGRAADRAGKVLAASGDGSQIEGWRTTGEFDDAVQSAVDNAAATAADRVQTGLDRVQTGADVVATGNLKTDVIGLKADVVTLKSDVTTLKSQTQTLHDDTQTLHDQTATLQGQAAASATLAGHYATDNTDTDVPGGSPGDRGAKWYSTQTAASVLAAGLLVTGAQNALALSSGALGYTGPEYGYRNGLRVTAVTYDRNGYLLRSTDTTSFVSEPVAPSGSQLSQQVVYGPEYGYFRDARVIGADLAQSGATVRISTASNFTRSWRLNQWALDDGLAFTGPEAGYGPNGRILGVQLDGAGLQVRYTYPNAVTNSADAVYGPLTANALTGTIWQGPEYGYTVGGRRVTGVALSVDNYATRLTTADGYFTWGGVWQFPLGSVTGPEYGYLNGNRVADVLTDQLGTAVTLTDANNAAYSWNAAWVAAGTSSGGSGAASSTYVPIWTTVSINNEAALITSQASYTVSLPSMTLNELGAKTTIPAQSVTLDPVTTNTVTDAALTWTVGNVASAKMFLAYASFSGLAIRTASGGGGSLVSASDYSFTNMGRGWANNTTNVAANATVYASYTGYSRRYDIIYIDPVTNAIGVAKGTDRGIDPENYPPVLPAGKIALYRAFVTNGNVQLIPVLKFRDFEMAGEEQYWRQLLQWNKRALAPFFRQVEKAAALKASGASAAAVAAITPALMLTGDSTQKCGGAANPAQCLIPNGTSSDSTAFFNSREAADTQLLLPRLSQTYDDTGTTNQYGAPFANYVAGSTNHIMIGAIWKLRAAIYARYGIWCPVLNMAWSGTYSANYIQVNGVIYTTDPGGWVDGVDDVRMGLLWPARLSAILSYITVPGTLVLPGHGTNEFGSATTYANIVSFIQQVQALGACVLVPGVRFPSTDRAAGDGVRFTNEQLARAAFDTGSAFSPIYKIEGPGYEGGCGCSALSFGNDSYNHPTIAQFAWEGALMAKSAGF